MKRKIYMFKKLLKNIGIFAFCSVVMVTVPDVAYAEENPAGSENEEVQIVIYAAPEDTAPVIGQAADSSEYKVVETVDEDWVCVEYKEYQGYICLAEPEAEEEAADPSELKRSEIVEFAKQFLGNPYVSGGTDPNRGVDCSGFTYYVMKHAAGVNLSHSSRAQSNEGRRISVEEMRPGDLIFYAKGNKINHVAIYAGDGQVVHASTEKTGIKLSKWDYRTPVAVVNVLGD